MGKKASQLQDLPLAQQRSACPREASSGQIIARHCWHSTVLPLCQASEQWPHQILKGGRKLLCANLADPAPAGAARDCGPAVAALLVYQPSTGLCMPLAVAVPLLLPLLVYQPSTGLSVPLAVAAPLLLPLLVYQSSTGLCVLLAVAVMLLLLGCGGHAVQIVPLVVSGRQPVPRGGVHSSRIANRRSVLQDVHEELQGGELHRH